MSKRTFLVLLVVVACVLAVIAFVRQRNYNHYNAGEVTTIESHGSAAPVQTEPEPVHIAKKEPAGKPVEEPNQAAEASAVASTRIDTGDALPPTSAAPGTTGTGRFQVYRQGNLTWRVDTQNGSTCVLFATDEEWQKPRVYRRACQQN